MAAQSPLLPSQFLPSPTDRLAIFLASPASAIPRNASRTFLAEGDRKQGDGVYSRSSPITVERDGRYEEGAVVDESSTATSIRRPLKSVHNQAARLSAGHDRLIANLKTEKSRVVCTYICAEDTLDRPTWVRLSNFAFVPKCDPTSTEDVRRLKKFVDKHHRLCVLTGAGVSTESGIPDYRSAEVGLYARNNRKPILYQEFCDSEATRRRYWARNYIGWPRFSSFKPNITHEILKHLEYVGKVECIVTQNIDNLHFKAGSKKVIELHGTAFKVMCLNCNHKICRYELQRVFQKLNPSMIATVQMIRPDGDVELPQAQVESFNVPVCDNCGGILKPDIIFFGDNVSYDKVQNVKANIESLDALLILGTSLSTLSAYRIVLQAFDAKKPIAIVNIGKTRADNFVNLKIEGRCGDVLSKI